MTRPAVIFFGPDGPPSQGAEVKVYLRALLYCTAKRAQILENMYVTLRRGESVQTFNIWVYGDAGRLLRGSGLRVSEDGFTSDHHFVLPKDGTHFAFLPGDYLVEVYAALVNSRPLLVSKTRLQLSQEQATAIGGGSGVYFDWGRIQGVTMRMSTPGRRSACQSDGGMPPALNLRLAGLADDEIDGPSQFWATEMPQEDQNCGAQDGAGHDNPAVSFNELNEAGLLMCSVRHHFSRHHFSRHPCLIGHDCH